MDILEKVQSIFSHMKVSEFMNSDVIYVLPNRTIMQVKEILRLKRISGVPVVDSQKKVIGIISIEDIIRSIEKNQLDSLVEEQMTRRVITVELDATLRDVMELFEKYGYGRFPVVDEKKRLVGIVTKNDILKAVAMKLGILYLHDERRKKALDEDIEKSLITGTSINKSDSDFYFKIDYYDINSIGIGAAQLKKFLLTKGIDEKLVRRIAISVYEAEANVVIHSGSTGEIYCFIKEDSIVVRVEDKGKGIENLELAMKEGFSTAPDHVRELGFGAGMGLPNIKRYSDKMVVLSEKDKGVIVEMIFFIN
ncbi:serine/threonine protein kinase [Thermosipho melanesiensis]|uniref:Serine/threonine protein kinase n=3 Tax=Thermosipho melanesiensis TaxID=46541 RepID=A0ABM6GDK3_9BACT|nr:CBS domain-containing protein [Thermosipho melanesiensis]ABR30492.1 putative signal transduction protein with CBS domains [Thermosipho melanesiensis BI429]APT73643.1 serine/threonine protein kinase [Thermosipho melanesiensis]OOC35585.1 serine/threonine protein kinase [Thermosipho melanesiensis]OOC39259.1 serine/threonine protein kinase [Thermosipho melanesiensis]OOC39345.1 serine/threonine protein kinase [Thermosipho melanesiensis]